MAASAFSTRFMAASACSSVSVPSWERSRRENDTLFLPAAIWSPLYTSNKVTSSSSDYRGELLIPLINHGSEPFTVEAGMRIAQLVVLPILTPELKEVTRLDTTERGAGGFGASGLS